MHMQYASVYRMQCIGSNKWRCCMRHKSLFFPPASYFFLLSPENLAKAPFLKLLGTLHGQVQGWLKGGHNIPTLGSLLQSM